MKVPPLGHGARGANRLVNGDHGDRVSNFFSMTNEKRTPSLATHKVYMPKMGFQMGFPSYPYIPIISPFGLKIYAKGNRKYHD
jgi:hypothetical protein